MSSGTLTTTIDGNPVKVTAAWLRFIRYVQVELPHGEASIRLVNGEPTNLLSSKPSIRFDREITSSLKE